jgi:hypothetical protein
MLSYFTSLSAANVATAYPTAYLLGHGSVIRATIDATTGLPSVVVAGGVMITNASLVQAVGGVWQLAASRTFTAATTFALQVRLGHAYAVTFLKRRVFGIGATRFYLLVL